MTDEYPASFTEDELGAKPYGGEVFEVITGRVPVGAFAYDPDDPESIVADNRRRAAKAAMVLRDYYEEHYRGEEAETVIGDFLADLLHLCDALGVDFDERCAAGARHYCCELTGQEF